MRVEIRIPVIHQHKNAKKEIILDAKEAQKSNKRGVSGRFLHINKIKTYLSKHFNLKHMNKKTLLYSVLFFVVATHTFSNVYGQCYIEAYPHDALMRDFRRSLPKVKPHDITFCTKLGNIYEIPFAFIVQCSFVLAGKEPYFYFYSGKSYRGEELDFYKNDTIRFYLSNGSILQYYCEDDYPGRKDQTISFYKLDKTGLDQLAKVAVDSIVTNAHLHLTSKSEPGKETKHPIVVRKLSDRNIKRIKEWAECLGEQM